MVSRRGLKLYSLGVLFNGKHYRFKGWSDDGTLPGVDLRQSSTTGVNKATGWYCSR